MKVVALNTSPRKGGNTEKLIRYVFADLESQGIETELISIGGQHIQGCKACYACGRNKNERCIIDDPVNDIIQKFKQADGIIIASPVYFADVTADMKAFLERAGMVANVNGTLFKNKAGACLVAVRRGGALHALETMNNWLHYMQTFQVGSSYWNLVFGREIGEVDKDEEGLRTMKTLAGNMIYLLKALETVQKK